MSLKLKDFLMPIDIWPLSCGLGKERLTEVFLSVSFMP